MILAGLGIGPAVLFILFCAIGVALFVRTRLRKGQYRPPAADEVFIPYDLEDNEDEDGDDELF